MACVMINVKYPYGRNMIVVNNHGKRQVREILEYEKPECQTHFSN